MKVKLWIDTGYAGCVHEETIEVDDNTTEKEIEDIAQEWLFDRIEYGWSVEKEWGGVMNIPKFRAYDKVREEVFEVISIDFERGYVALKSKYGVFCSCVGEFELMQSTGLIDENKVDIFEGDIVFDSFYNKQGKIIFTNAAFFVEYDYTTEPLFKNVADLKVIGNIYKNPELIGGK